jgi:GST-like protein
MIDFYFFPSPNGLKVAIMLEETGLEYRLLPVDISKGEQFDPKFLAISPNNKIPAIVDQAGEGGPLSLFESGAILEYLAEKSGQLLPLDTRRRFLVKQWLYWQVAHLGPMAGQANHFRAFAPERVPYGIKRYTDEVNRLYGVLDRQLAGRDFIADIYSIADIAAWPWIVPYERAGQRLEDFPNLQRWFYSVGARPAVQKAYALGHEKLLTPEEYRFLLNQTAQSVTNFTPPQELG